MLGAAWGAPSANASSKQARADGYRAMVFNAIVETNARAVKLWRSLGFDVLATVPEGFHHPVDGYVGCTSCTAASGARRGVGTRPSDEWRDGRPRAGRRAHSGATLW
jgi:hypothetical protein